MSVHAKEFLAVHFALDAFAHIVWGTRKPLLVLTDNQALTRFFQKKTIPPPLWNAVDHVLSFNFILGHIPGIANPASDFLSRMHTNPEDRLELKISDKLNVKQVEINLKAKLPDNELMALFDDDVDSDGEEEGEDDGNFLQQISASMSLSAREKLALLAQMEEERKTVTTATMFTPLANPLSLSSLEDINPLDRFDLTGRMQRLEMAHEQAKDTNIQTVKSWIKEQRIPDTRFANQQLKKYHKHLPRLTIKDNILWRKFYDDVGNVSLQLVIPEHLTQDLFFRIHNSKHSGNIGITKTIKTFREKFYTPGFSEAITKYIRNCPTCLAIKPAKMEHQTPPLRQLASAQNYPGDMLQVDIVGKLQPLGLYTHILTAMDVTTKYLFAIPLTKASASKIALELYKNFHATCIHPNNDFD